MGESWAAVVQETTPVPDAPWCHFDADRPAGKWRNTTSRCTRLALVIPESYDPFLVGAMPVRERDTQLPLVLVQTHGNGAQASVRVGGGVNDGDLGSQSLGSHGGESVQRLPPADLCFAVPRAELAPDSAFVLAELAEGGQSTDFRDDDANLGGGAAGAGERCFELAEQVLAPEPRDIAVKDPHRSA